MKYFYLNYLLFLQYYLMLLTRPSIPGVMGNRGIMLFISGEQGNTCLKMKGKGNKDNFKE